MQKGHFPGFDGLRLIAALAVLFSHAFVVLTGVSNSTLPAGVVQFFDELGGYAVATFFVISAFLLTRSLTRNSDPVSYGVNRALRLLPGFVFYVVVAGLLMGPLFTTRSWADYFGDVETVNFFSLGLNSMHSLTLPGVFEREGEMSSVINGSLWSLHYEALSYLFLITLWIWLRTGRAVATAAVIVVLLTAGTKPIYRDLGSIAYTLPYFVSGILMYFVHVKFGVRGLLAAISVAAFAMSLFLGLRHQIAFPLFGAYAVVWIGEQRFLTNFVGGIGDLSYGIYLIGWPAEQMVVQMTGTRSPWVVMVLALPIAVVYALVSYRLVEKPAMERRNTASKKIQAGIDRVVEWTGVSKDAAAWSAKIAFVIGGIALLLSESRWWYLMTSLGWLLAITIMAALLGSLIHRAMGGPRKGAAIEAAAGD
jgi:peptidoglycan/LPS O-acetylase OafA/YrhL